MMSATEEKRMQKIKERMEKLETEKKAILARQKEREKKKNDRRLIQLGLLSEKVFNCHNIDLEDYQKLLEKMINIPAVMKLVEPEKNQPKKSKPVKKQDKKSVEVKEAQAEIVIENQPAIDPAFPEGL